MVSSWDFPCILRSEIHMNNCLLEDESCHVFTVSDTYKYFASAWGWSQPLTIIKCRAALFPFLGDDLTGALTKSSFTLSDLTDMLLVCLSFVTSLVTSCTESLC